ncbi:MAG: hypothetical protein JOZ53_15840, partial [Planctomycetaceae bacterium]|nr:hypothetical protein [Planctomycetaceae bacterium]
MNVEPLVQPVVAVEATWIALGIFENATGSPDAAEGTPLADAIGRLLAAKE